MARDGFGVYSPPAGTLATSNTAIESAKYNAFVNDLTADANTARPVVAGGTGATTASAALVNMGLTATAAELNYTDGVTSPIQTQLNAKQASDATLTSLAGLTLVQGDLLYATAADTVANLAKGTGRQLLAMNPGATAPEWIDDEYYGVLQSAYTLTSTTTRQKLFNWSANGALTLPAGTYRFDCGFTLTGMSATSGNAAFAILGAGTASITTVRYYGYAADSNTLPISADLVSANVENSSVSSATATTSTALLAHFFGVFDVGSAGTIIPSVSLGAAAAASVNAGSFFICRKMGPTATAAVGPWS